MYARPSSKETEEDILKLQEEFLKKKACNEIIPAAKISKESVDSKTENAHENLAASNTQIQLENTFESIPSNINIGRIVEKTPTKYNGPQLEFTHRKGFPQAKRRDPSITGAKGSIFSQQMKRLKKEVRLDDINCASTSGLTIKENQPMDISYDIKQNVNIDLNNKVTNIPQQSYILTGNEKDEIHKQNVEILKQMSEKDILEERNKLLSTMDPAIVAFLRAKRKDENQSRTVSIAEQNEAAENISIEEIESSKEIVTHPEAEKWLNFDRIETGKLAWMTEFEIPKVEKGKTYEAR
ncbi:hypothetical protein ILUMI_23566 [Ignelater luminosus]|uniref:RPAP1 N-terminal domain-containing protein n=1 Tax=Ignelater luminosus TaxID=2038154 RepID=A0A8K0G1R7_IGNLU|nr:hypothetical protein ILUMI_23566 [Ignelater luminosus]